MYICVCNIIYYIACLSWRQTGSCKWDGTREPINDRSCNVVIESGWSGYCECSPGQKTMKKDCFEGRRQTCTAACNAALGNVRQYIPLDLAVFKMSVSWLYEEILANSQS